MWVQTLKEYLSLDADHFIPGHGPVGGKNSVTALLDYLNNVGKVMKEMIALGKSENEVLKRGGEIEYPLSGGSSHISTLKKWYKTWRARNHKDFEFSRKAREKASKFLLSQTKNQS